MRRVAGYVLLCVGVFLIALAPVLKFYAYPNLAVIPQDQNSGTVATGVGTYYDPAVGLIDNANLVATRAVRGDVAASVKAGDGTVIWNAFTRIERLEDSHLVTARTDRVAFDERTGIAKACCGNTPGRRGVTYTFPIPTEKKTYPYSDTSVGKDFPVKFVDTATLKGLEVYHFVSVIEPVQIGAPREVPGALMGAPDQATVTALVFYANTRDIWVEPTTGVVIKGSEQLQQTLRTPDSDEDKATLLKATLVFNDKTQTSQAATASDGKQKINLLSLYGPLLGLLLGAILAIVGLLMLRSSPSNAGRRRRSTTQDSEPGQLQPTKG